MRVAVVGHVEWIEFARVPHYPAAGEIVHAEAAWEEPGGGGAVAAVQLAKLAGACDFFTALGDDEAGRRSKAELERLGVTVHAAVRREPQRWAFVHVDGAGERTITVVGSRLGPRGDDELPWERLAGAAAVYFTAGDAQAARWARAARKLVATARGLEVLAEAAIALDALVHSARDPGERYEHGDLDPAPLLVASTQGPAGGEWERRDGERGRWVATAPPGPLRDAYGCGDSFAAGLTYALGSGLDAQSALELAARCGAACLTGDGPYRGQLTAAAL